MDPTAATAATILEQLREDLRAGLAGQSAEALNWRPTPDGNSIAGLVAHLSEASNFLLHAGKGETVPRDREAQFAATTPDADTLLARIDAAWEPLLQLARSYTAADLAATRDIRGRQRSGAWCLLHACEHAAEHWGQIQLTRDLYAARG